MTRKEVQVQVQALLNGAIATDIEIYNSLLRQRVVLEESEVSNYLTIATLKKHGAELAVFENFTQYDVSLEAALRNMDGTDRLATKPKPRYNIPTRIINKSQIASIQSLEDILQGRKFEDFFGEN